MGGGSPYWRSSRSASSTGNNFSCEDVLRVRVLSVSREAASGAGRIGTEVARGGAAQGDSGEAGVKPVLDDAARVGPGQRVERVK